MISTTTLGSEIVGSIQNVASQHGGFTVRATALKGIIVRINNHHKLAHELRGQERFHIAEIGAKLGPGLALQPPTGRDKSRQ